MRGKQAIFNIQKRWTSQRSVSRSLFSVAFPLSPLSSISWLHQASITSLSLTSYPSLLMIISSHSNPFSLPHALLPFLTFSLSLYQIIWLSTSRALVHWSACGSIHNSRIFKVFVSVQGLGTPQPRASSALHVNNHLYQCWTAHEKSRKAHTR